MKKILLNLFTIFLVPCILASMCPYALFAATRDGNVAVRAKSGTSTPAITTQTAPNVSARGATMRTTERGGNTAVSARTAATVTARDTSTAAPAQSRGTVARATTATHAPRATVSGPRNIPIPQKATVARAATTTETRTGAEYEQCKAAYFTCMDQFCAMKNDDYRRCSCSDRVYEFDDTRSVMQQAGEKLTAFTENLDVVGMTAAQATAMRTESDGERSLTSDGSASKALLQAIMNSITGGDTNVGGKYSDLNSINLSFDTANAFGMTDAGQAIAAYNGTNLYTAIYGQCRNVVRDQCNDASLQRAVTAYLMAVEQDCNTVAASIADTKKKMTAAVREGNAMLDLARVENRQNRNSDNMTACLANVEAAVQSEEVCGKNYYKCLDNGEFIDISTGKPIAGVIKFYELESLLKFNDSIGIADQKLSKVSNNRTFVQNFEKRVKKFAQPALDKCTEKADDVWADYLDKAMLDIFYAQKAKVAEIKQGCFDFVSSCYVNGDNALTIAMQELLADAAVVLQPDKITLNAAICTEYVASCDNMFDGNIVQQYIDNRQDTDTLTACRAVAKQCFDKFGGTGYENFYYPFSGLFNEGHAPDWFTLCADENCTSYKSECAKQLSQISSCSSRDMMRQTFGGFDIIDGDKYGLVNDNGNDEWAIRPTGVATEVYYQIMDILNTQCNNVQGRFVELQFLKKDMYEANNICISRFANGNGEYQSLMALYGIPDGENMCPRDYVRSVDTKSWGACLCWENGARRSRNGTSIKCVEELPKSSGETGGICPVIPGSGTQPVAGDDTPWCTQNKLSVSGQVCPGKTTGTSEIGGKCLWSDPNYASDVEKIPAAIAK